MRHPFFTSTKPLVFAHRGGAALAPENTLAAFANGLSLGADGIELDVRLSRDGIVVVHHDATLERTTGLSGPLAQRSAAELERANVPTLDAALAVAGSARVIIELKENTAALADAAVACIVRAKASARVCVGSFGARVLRRVRKLAPDVATSGAREEVRWALYRSWCGLPVMSPPYAGYQIPERSGTTRVVSARFVAHAHRAGLGVQVWTVDEEDQARRLLGWGVDALITDRPDVMVPLVRSFADQARTAGISGR